ncbi:MAG: hypothetical protein M3Y26_12385 [Actinomycetota bacterium]|nr:hypothetical protein [Actinomycetota bacterium]
MTATVLATALPYSLDADASFHLTVFLTHKLVPDPPPPDDPDRMPVLGDFPAVADWVTTLAACTLTLSTSVDPARAIPLRVVSSPAADAAAWAACLPTSVPVAGFPTPALSQQVWHSNPAHRMSDHAVDLHISALTAAPTRRPAVEQDPVAGAILDRMTQLDQRSVVQQLRAGTAERSRRATMVLGERNRNAIATIGPLTETPTNRPGDVPVELPAYGTTFTDTTSPIEVLLDDPDGDTRLTERLDKLVGTDLSADPQLQLLADAHAMRRYYERPEQPQQPPRREPDPQAPPPPRLAVPDRDFHARVGGFGSTPTLLRRLGLAVDVVVDDPNPPALLAGASWVSVTITPPDGTDLTVLPARRTSVSVRRGAFRTVSSPEWIGGALPLGNDDWRILDLDPDASGLKLDQHLRGLVRQYASEANGDPATSAPGTLRSTGFAVARVDRADATRTRVAAAEAIAADDGSRELQYDDLVRGIRVEVWDDVTKAWHSLHRRRVTVTGVGGEAVLDDAEDVGFLQLSALNRAPGDTTNGYYIHEVVAGWDGWSLSAPRPGKVIVHVEPPGPDGSTEAVVDRGEDANGDASAGGIHTRTRVEPGSLPRLRYGTSYSFRILGVDLAGNTVPQVTLPLIGRPPFDRPPLSGPRLIGEREVAAAGQHLDALRESYARRDASSLAESLRPAVLAHLGGAPDGAERETAAARDAEGLPEALRTGDDGADATFARMLGVATARAQSASGAGPSLGTSGKRPDVFDQVSQAVRHFASAERPWRVRPQLGTDPAVLAQLAAGGAEGVDDAENADHGQQSGNAVAGAAQAAAAPILLRNRTVTAPRPYLRWDPVPFPAIVARTALGTGEQLSRLVVRSFGSAADATAVDDLSTSERHIAPPKATQMEAETAGRFDAAIGTADTAAIAEAYRTAVVERGTFLDKFAPNLDDPNVPVEQPGIALVSRLGADPATAVTLDDITDHRGIALGEGQYVAHDTDGLRLPYLPDPYASGATLVFYQAGAPHALPEPRVLQSVTVPYPGAWPRVQPLRIVLGRSTDPSATLQARVDGHEVHVTVPRGEQVRAWLSSSIRADDLSRFGLWRSHYASTIDPDGDGGASQDDLAAAVALWRAASSGWTWWLTPSTELRLVHAVPQPVRPPTITALTVAMRPPGRAVLALAGVVDLHGPSTDRLQVRAAWTESIDDLSTGGPTVVTRNDIVVNSPVAETERAGLLSLVDFLPFGAGVRGVDLAEGSIGLHAAIQKFPDTHHRVVTYTPSGTTRYREFFDAADVPGDDDPSLAGEPVTLDIQSSARPAAVHIVDTVPLLRWEKQVEPAEPFAVRQTRRSGIRIWLARPWFSSGDGELLGVLVFNPFEPDPDHPGQQRLKALQAPDAASSLWGADPITKSGGPVPGPTGATNPPLVQFRDLLLRAVSQVTIPITPEPARPVAIADTLPLVDVHGTPVAGVYGYVPEYDAETKRWFVDVAMEDGPTLWPFVRLAVARYQPSSLAGYELSPVALTSWAQPLPTRMVTVSRLDPGRVQVTLSGTVAYLRLPGNPNASLGALGPDEQITGDTPTGQAGILAGQLRQTRTVRISLQSLPAGAGDLGWQTWTTAEIRAVSVTDGPSFKATWTGELKLPAESGTPVGDAAGVPPLRTPGGPSSWRVLVEEHELLDADDLGQTDPAAPPIQVPRLVYADTISL